MTSCLVPYVLCCMCFITQSCQTLRDPMDCSPPGSSVHGDSPGKNTEVGCHALLQGIFPTQGSNPDLLHCRWVLYCLSHQENPRILEWVACPFSRGSSWPRNWTRVSCIAGGFFKAELPGKPHKKSPLPSVLSALTLDSSGVGSGPASFFSVYFRLWDHAASVANTNSTMIAWGQPEIQLNTCGCVPIKLYFKKQAELLADRMSSQPSVTAGSTSLGSTNWGSKIFEKKNSRKSPNTNT